MKLLQYFVIIICVFVSVIAKDDGNHLSKVKSGEELQLLQGTWTGVQVGFEERITITITGNTLHFHRDADFWFKTTITLPAGKEPKQLHATIRECAPSQVDSVGEVVRAFYVIENGTLTLATIGEDAEETPEGFAAAGTRYELRKVQPEKIGGDWFKVK